MDKRALAEHRADLLDWYDRHTREVPWRARRGEIPDPYRVWLSEIMCQQTTVQAVKPYFEKFIQNWPRVEDLAAAEEGDVLAAWAGLGYYARARNLHKCAQIVTEALGGQFPVDLAALQKLPGIGEYTASAILAMAFHKPAVVVDGNVERVMARFFAVEEPLPAVKPHLKMLAGQFYDGAGPRTGCLAQGFMDLGSGICIPKAPRCALCPLKKGCAGFEKGMAADLPVRLKAKDKPRKYGHVYWVVNERGEVLFHKRPAKGLFGGMVGLPTTAWEGEKQAVQAVFERAQSLKATVHHSFTHFDLELLLHAVTLESVQISGVGLYWGHPEAEIPKMPSLFKKAARMFEV